MKCHCKYVGSWITLVNDAYLCSESQDPAFMLLGNSYSTAEIFGVLEMLTGQIRL